MYQLIYDYPRNRELIKKYHGYYKKNPSWEPQGGARGSSIDTVRIDGVEYYRPPRQDPANYDHLKNFNVEGGKISKQDVKDFAKKAVKKGVSIGLDQIPKVSGLALGALPALVGQPELAPVTGFIGTELGKQGRKYIKDKYGLGMLKGGAAIGYPSISKILLNVLADKGIDLSGSYDYFVKNIGGIIKPILKKHASAFLDMSLPALGKAISQVSGNEDLGKAFNYIARTGIKQLTGVGKPRKAPVKRATKEVGVYKEAPKKRGGKCGGAKKPRQKREMTAKQRERFQKIREYRQKTGCSQAEAMKAVSGK